MRDFTLQSYERLISTLKEQGYKFLTFEEFCSNRERFLQTPERWVILRHDVDKKAYNSLKVAQIEASLGVKATYFFRVTKGSNCPDVIRSIVTLGHEVGYHYEDMAIAKGDVAVAIKHFVDKVAYFRQFYPVRTICMHGAPTSQWDGKLLWQTYDYHDYDLLGEPYLDVDYSNVFYLTDTGRCWDGYKVSVRDKIPTYQDLWIEQGLTYHSTDDIVQGLSKNGLPSKIMITTHPQRWTNNWMEWGYELLAQNTKNVIKKCLIRLRK